jgi:hypothetical protein
METGWIDRTWIEGGRIRVAESDEVVHFKWPDCTINPKDCGHGTQVMFHVIIERGKRGAIGVVLRPPKNAG